jgi:hypothetical protein
VSCEDKLFGMSALDRVAKMLRREQNGLLTVPEVRDEIFETLATAERDRDPELLGASMLALDSSLLDEESFSCVAHVSFRAIMRSPPYDKAAATEARARIVDYVEMRLSSRPDLRTRASIIAAMPIQWVAPSWILQTTDMAHDHPDRVDVLHTLLPAFRYHYSDVGAYAIGVEPNLESASPEAVSLVASAYETLRLNPRNMADMRDYLRRNKESLQVDDLIRLAVRLSIEFLDDMAVAFVRTAIDLGLEPPRTPVAATVLWIAGEREDARRQAARFERSANGWGSQAAKSLAAFIHAQAAPLEEKILMLAPPASEGLHKRPATVGALVGRLALVRMLAYSALNLPADAALEAHAVIFAHHYRGYDLHMQGRDQEFDVRLVDRLAVTPDEVLEARAIVDANSEVQSPEWLLMEGRLIRRA